MLEGMIPYLCRATKQTLLLVILLVAVFSQVSLVFAQGGPFGGPGPVPNTNPAFPIGGPGTFPVPTSPAPSPNTPNDGGTGGGTGGDGADSGGAAETTDAAQNQTEELPPVYVTDGASCWNSASGFFNCLVVGFFGSLVAIAGYTFDSAISLFIVGFGDLYINAGIGYTVENVWTTIRDVFNLTFIFGLVYIGFQIILGTNESGAKRTIPFLILAALLVNFSLFIVKFIIDFANLAAVQVFNLFTVSGQIGDQNVPTKGIVDILTTPEGPSLALAFLNTIGVSGLLNHNAAQNAEAAPIIYMFVMIIIFLVLTYVFFAGAILITVRFAVLIFYMIFSPIMFLGWVFPGMKSYSDKFWNGLFGQAFFAPALLFMLYISYKLAQGFNDGQRTGVSAVGNDSSNISAFASFMPYLVVVVIFLLGSLIIAKKMANQGADMVGKVNDWALKQGKAAIGGYGAAAYLGYKGLDKTATSNSKLARYTGATLAAKGISKYTGARDALEKSYKGSYLGSSSAARDKRAGELAGRIESAQEAKDGNKKIALAEAGATELAALRTRDYTSLTATEKDRLITLESNQAAADKYITGMGKSDIEKLSPAKRKEYANRFSSEQVGKILESEKISATEKAALFGSRVSSITTKIGGTTPTADKTTKLTRDELDTLGFEWVTRNAHMLTATQFDDYLKNSKKMTPEVAETLKNRRKNELLSQIQAGTAGSILTELKKKPKEFAQLPKEALIENVYLEKIYGNITTAVLEQIATEKTIGPAERANLKAFLLNPMRITGIGGVTRDVKDYLRSDEGKKYYGA